MTRQWRFIGRLLPDSLLNRVFLLFAATLAAMLAGGLAVFAVDHVGRQIEEANLTATMVIEIAAQTVVDAALVNDHDAIHRTLRAAVARTPFKRARFIELGGTVLDEHAVEAVHGYVPEAVRAFIADRLPEVNRVIAAGGRDYGVLRLDFDVDRVVAPIWSVMLGSLGLGLCGLLLGLVLTRWLLARWLAYLGQLGDLADRINAGQAADTYGSTAHDMPEEFRRAIEQFSSATGGLRLMFSQQIDGLNHSLSQHKMATDQAMIVLELDPDGTVTEVNELFCAVSGLSRAAMIGRCDGWSLRPALYRACWLADRGTGVWHGEVECRHADGHPVWVKRAVVPIVDARGEAEKYICLDIDISREKAAEARLSAEKERAEVTLHSIADGVITVDSDGRVRYANPAARRIVAAPERSLAGVALDEILCVLESHDMPAATAPAQGRRCRVRFHDGRQAVVELSQAPLHGAAGERSGDVIAFRDVTQEHRASQELRKLSLAVQHAASAIFITNPGGCIEYVNPTFTRMTGFAFGEICGQTPRFLKSGEVAPEIYHAMWAAVRNGLTWRGEIVNRRKDGTTFWCSMTLSAVLDQAGKPRQYIAVMEDATERKQAEATIHRLAYFDTLTALPNRRMFMERAVEAVKAARTAATPLAVCYLDLDGFKSVNDTLGHQAGDALLAEVARRIRDCLAPDDFLGRLGGDEFALLLHGPQQQATVAAAGKAIIDALQQAFIIDGEEIRIGTSVGVALHPEDGQDVADLLRKADMALYQAKELGKGRLAFFTDELETGRRERAELAAALAQALPRDQLRLVYQPKIDIRSKAVVGAEALIRWHHPERGLVRPDEFVPLAEETRLIVPIGLWVIQEACRQIRAWTAQGMGDMHVAVNIATVQLRSADLADDIEHIVKAAGIDPCQLELEITESGLMEDPEGAARTLKRLRDFGITIAIDDFGTGYSSLAYLKNFPVDVLKIDRSFVRDLEADANDRGIAEAVISMARVLKVAVVAEGVETRGQFEILEDMGCQLAQGYYFSKPVSAASLAAFWGRHRERRAYLPTDMGTLID